MSIFKRSHEKKGIHMSDPKIKKQLDDIAEKAKEKKPLVAINVEGKLHLENAEHLTEAEIKNMKERAALDWQEQEAILKKVQKKKDRLAKLGMEKVDGGRKIHFLEIAEKEVMSLQSEMAEAVEWLKKHGYKKYLKDTVINRQAVKAGEWFKDYTPKLTDDENKAQLEAYYRQQENIEEVNRARNIRALAQADEETIQKMF